MLRRLQILLSIVFAFALSAPILCAAPVKKAFTLVIDAGHGGHDAGAVGAYSKEKNINLRVALALGQLIEANCPDVKVIYTRRTDVFIPLQRRADIANEAKADLFVSVHTNALPAGRQAYGSETYTLGMARAGQNLEVAKRENSVITLENNYQQTYKGFDPNKAESYVIFELMQDSYMKQSVDLASRIQREYKRAGRPNKGVHQAGFLVLRNTSMPSVLTELGFITTPEEEAYLNSPQGVEQLSRSIYNGILGYMRANSSQGAALPPDLPTTDQATVPTEVAEPAERVSDNGEVAVVPVKAVRSNERQRQQTAVRRTDITPAQQPRQSATPVEKPKQQTAQATPRKTERQQASSERTKEREAAPKAKPAQSARDKDREEASNAKAKANQQTSAQRNKAKEKDRDEAPKAKGKGDQPSAAQRTKAKDKDRDEAPKGKTTQRTKAKDETPKTRQQQAQSSSKKKGTAAHKVTYRIQVGAGKRQIDTDDPQFKGLDVERVKEGTFYKYFYGTYTTYAAAQKALRKAQAKLPGAYIVAYVGGKSVAVADARKQENP